MQTHYSNEEILNMFPNANFAWIHNTDIQKVLSHLNNIEWYFVGGCVRDSLINRSTTDIDITTTASPDDIELLMKNFTHTTIGKKFGTIGVYIKQWKIEITTTRHDIQTFGRHAIVNFEASFYEDSARRDFTVNGLLYNGATLIDWHNGLIDLKNQHIKFIGCAQKRIEEDYLRVIRYIRFFYRFYYGNKLEYKDEIKFSLGGLYNVSKERFCNEIEQICKNENRIYALNALNSTSLSMSMFGCNLNITKIDILYKYNFIHMDFIFTSLFINVDDKILQNIPLSKNVYKFIKWCKNTDNIILQCAKIFNNTKNYEYMLFFALMKDENLYHKLSNISNELPKFDLMQFKPEYRSLANDLYIGVKILEYVKE